MSAKQTTLEKTQQKTTLTISVIYKTNEFPFKFKTTTEHKIPKIITHTSNVCFTKKKKKNC